MPLLSLSQYCMHATLNSDCLAEKKEGGEGHSRIADWHSKDIRSTCSHSMSEKLALLKLVYKPHLDKPHPQVSSMVLRKN